MVQIWVILMSVHWIGKHRKHKKSLQLVERKFIFIYLFISYLQMFSFSHRYFLLLCSCLHKRHKMKLLPLCCLFLPFVFYGNTLYLCKTTIDKNSYEAKATYIPIMGNRSNNGTSGIHNIISYKWCFGRAVKHSPFCHGSLLCCSKTHLPFMPLSVGTYNISCFFSPPQAYAIWPTK